MYNNLLFQISFNKLLILELQYLKDFYKRNGREDVVYEDRIGDISYESVEKATTTTETSTQKKIEEVSPKSS
jgi:hypothetical protein